MDRINALPKDQRSRLVNVTWAPMTTSGKPGPIQEFIYTNGTLVPASTPSFTNIDSFITENVPMSWTYGTTNAT